MFSYCKTLSRNFEWVMDVINASNWANCSQAYTNRMFDMLVTYYNENKDNLILAEKTIIDMMNSITPDELETMARYKHPEYNICAALTLCVRDLTQGK